MAFPLSPKVEIKEIDQTNIIPAVATTDVAFAGIFNWGPIRQRRLISNEKELVRQFGAPDDVSYEHFFQAANVLKYTNKLRLVRVAHEVQETTALSNKMTTTEASNVISITHTDHGLAHGAYIRISSSSGIDDIPASEINGKHQISLVDSNTYTIEVTTAGTAGVTNGGGTILVGSEDVALNATASKYTGSPTLPGEGILIRNEDHYLASFEAGGGDVGVWAAKYAGILGNSLKISICPSASAFSKTLTGTVSTSGTSVTGSGSAFTTELVVGSILVHPVTGEERKIAAIDSNTAATLDSAFSSSLSGATVIAKWEYHSEFGVAPATSAYAASRNCSNDECHIIVVDAGGLFTGRMGEVLERFPFVSLMDGAKTDQGEANFYKTVINNRSRYVWWMDHLPAGTNWGSKVPGTTFTNVIIPHTVTLAGGEDGTSTVTQGELQNGFDLFAQAEEVDVSVLVASPGNIAIGEYITQNICEVRKDCVSVISVPKSTVVDNAGDEVADIRSAISSLSASSYAIVDSNWGYQYDRYKDTYRYLPCNAHVAGLMARVDTERDPWWSPAGLMFGHLKDVFKLAWNPTEPQRDDLYLMGVNPINSIPGQGVVLFGDKTYLNRPSAFDRINVRRLFIVLEKAIATASKFILFQFNDEITRAQFRNLVEPFLREVKGRRGITDFEVVCDESNNPGEVIDRNQFIGDIFIKPNRVINYITLNFVATPTGVQFSESIDALRNNS